MRSRNLHRRIGDPLSEVWTSMLLIAALLGLLILSGYLFVTHL